MAVGGISIEAVILSNDEILGKARSHPTVLINHFKNKSKKSRDMKKLMSIIAIAFFATTIFAQREQTIIGDSGWGFSGAWGGWSYNYGQINKNNQQFNGGTWALEFGKKFYIGGLHYDAAYNQNGSTAFNMRVNNLLLGFTPMSYRPIHPVISVALGNGRLTQETSEVRDRVFVVQPQAGIEFNVTRWCHIDAQVGYRFVSDTQFLNLSDSNLSGVYGQVNLKFGYSWGRYKTTKRVERD